jgi:hypothetical protein
MCGGVCSVIWRKKSTDLLLYWENLSKLDHVTSKEKTIDVEVIFHL